MNELDQDTEFESYQALLDAKRRYEAASRTILVVDDCKKIKVACEVAERLVYHRIVYKCKAGDERASESKGIRQTATYKKNCSVKVSSLKLLLVRSVNF